MQNQAVWLLTGVRNGGADALAAGKQFIECLTAHLLAGASPETYVFLVILQRLANKTRPQFGLVPRLSEPFRICCHRGIVPSRSAPSAGLSLAPVYSGL